MLGVGNQEDNLGTVGQPWAQAHALVVGKVLVEKGDVGLPFMHEVLRRFGIGKELIELAMGPCAELLFGDKGLALENEQAAIGECRHGADTVDMTAFSGLGRRGIHGIRDALHQLEIMVEATKNVSSIARKRTLGGGPEQAGMLIIRQGLEATIGLRLLKQFGHDDFSLGRAAIQMVFEHPVVLFAANENGLLRREIHYALGIAARQAVAPETEIAHRKDVASGIEIDSEDVEAVAPLVVDNGIKVLADGRDAAEIAGGNMLGKRLLRMVGHQLQT